MPNMNLMGGMPGLELENTTWYNPKTNDTLTVRNTFFENNNLFIQTTDGRMINYDKFSNYIQADQKQIQNMKRNSLDKKPVNESLPPEVTKILAPTAPTSNNQVESLDAIDSKLNAEAMNLLNPQAEPQIIETKPLGNIYNVPVNNLNYEIIQKALKDKSTPKCDIKITWKDCPLDNIKALVDMFGISKEELVEYYQSKIDVNEIVENVKKAILKIFNPEEEKKMEEQPKPVEKKPVETKVEEKPTKPAKTEQKKTTQKVKATKKVKKTDE
jgi:hypothetical protein